MTEQPAHFEAIFNPTCSLVIHITRNISGKEKLWEWVYVKCYDMDEFVLNQEICWAEYLLTNSIMPEECTLPVPHACNTFICQWISVHNAKIM